MPGCKQLSSCHITKNNQKKHVGWIKHCLLTFLHSCFKQDMKINLPVSSFCFHQSVENCVCILHNLTYQLEAECPQCFQQYRPKTDAEFDVQKSPIGCFSPKSAKAQKEVPHINQLYYLNVAGHKKKTTAPPLISFFCLFPSFPLT